MLTPAVGLVVATGLNFVDTLMIQGRYQSVTAPPFTVGSEVTGTIEAMGDNVVGWGWASSAAQRPWAAAASPSRPSHPRAASSSCPRISTSAISPPSLRLPSSDDDHRNTSLTYNKTLRL